MAELDRSANEDAEEEKRNASAVTSCQTILQMLAALHLAAVGMNEKEDVARNKRVRDGNSERLRARMGVRERECEGVSTNSAEAAYLIRSWF